MKIRNTNRTAPRGHKKMHDFAEVSRRLTRLVQSQQWDLAYQESKDLLRRDPMDFVALESFAHAAWHLGRYRESARTCQKLLALNSHEPGYLTLEGMCWQQLGRHQTAVDCFRRAYAIARRSDTRQRIRMQLDFAESLALMALDQAGYRLSEEESVNDLDLFAPRSVSISPLRPN